MNPAVAGSHSSACLGSVRILEQHAAGMGNLYLRLEATTVPEPSTVTMTFAAAGLLAMLSARKRRRK